MKKREFKKNFSLFWRAYIITTISILCPVLLAVGIFMADSNIRADASDEWQAVFSVQNEGGDIKISAFGSTAQIERRWIEATSVCLSRAASFIPPEARVVLNLLVALRPASS